MAQPPLDRESALRLVVETMGVDHVAYYPKLAARFGSTSAILLAQLFYWTKRQIERGRMGHNGWLYKSMRELREETGMGRWEIESARRRLLTEGVLETHVAGMPRVTYYRINFDRLVSVLGGRPNTKPDDWQRNDFVVSLLGRPLLMNRTLAKIAGGINGALYLSFLTFVTRKQLKQEPNERAWIVDQSLESISDILFMTQRQSSYTRSAIRRMGLIEEWRTGSLPARTRSRICWANLANALLDLQQPAVNKLSTAELSTVHFSVDNLGDGNVNPTQAKLEFDVEIARKPAPMLRPQDSCGLDSTKPTNWTKQNQPTEENKTNQLDLTVSPNQTRQNQPTVAQVLSSPITGYEYTGIKPYPPPPTQDLAIAEGPKAEWVEVVFPKLIPEHLRQDALVILNALTKTTTRFTAQELVDELVARLRRPQLGVISNQLGYLRKLVNKAVDGTLVLEMAQQEHRFREEQNSPTASNLPQLPVIDREASREASERCLAEARRLFGRARTA